MDAGFAEEGSRGPKIAEPKQVVLLVETSQGSGQDVFLQECFLVWGFQHQNRGGTGSLKNKDAHMNTQSCAEENGQKYLSRLLGSVARR